MMHLRPRFESAARLFQKVGRVPKERLCKQDVGISDLEMLSFLETCVDFLDICLEVSILVATDRAQHWQNKKGRMRVTVFSLVDVTLCRLVYGYHVSGETPFSIFIS
jgi:hypothetical protein